jgi:hypothetical protein
MTDTTITPPPSVPTISNPTPESWTDTQKILALLYSVAFIAVIILLIFTSPKADPQIFAVLTTLVGVLANQVGSIVSYYFGSTKNSQTKDQTISALSNPAPKVTP